MDRKKFVLQDRKEEQKTRIKEYTIPENIRKKLFPYQINHLNNLLYALSNHKTVIDASDTGTGKTYCAVALCKMLGLKPFIICPKPVVYSWKKVCDIYHVKYITIVNYETLRNGKILVEEEPTITNYINIIDGSIAHKTSINTNSQNSDTKLVYFQKPEKKTKTKKSYSWNLPRDNILIFDEAHKCKNPGTLNSLLLRATMTVPNPVLLLSATLIDKPDNFSIYGSLIGIKNIDNFIHSFQSQDLLIRKLHQLVFPDHGARMRIKELGSIFPDNLILPEIYEMHDVEKEIQQCYDIIQKSLNELKGKEKNNNVLTMMLRARQRIELLKLPLMAKLIIDHLENNLSVVVFLNFNDSIKILAKYFKTKSLIVGSQKDEERNQIINDFQTNKSRLIICNAQSGGTGISLHDLDGKYPRISLISPNWSVILFVQILGRIHRSGAKSNAIQKIIYCANTIEEKIAQIVKKKVNNLSLLNDGEMNGII
jgi:hypothetical protein